MNQDDELIVRLSKEIIVKFIELGRVSPSGFESLFRNIFWTLKKTVVDSQAHRLDQESFDSLDDSSGD